MQTPDFWYRRDSVSRLLASVLSPIGRIYGASVARKAKRRAFRARPRVVCVGGLTVGGSGKTPIAIAVADGLLKRGLRPVFLTRGYGGRLRGPRWVDPDRDSARDVGDEPLLLARVAPAVLSRNRRAGAIFAGDCDVIVMDDGHQNFQLTKDFSIVVLYAQDPFGNGLVFPAGPLREPPDQGLARANAVVLMGDGDGRMPSFAGPVLRANLEPSKHASFAGARVIAFAGIGRPSKFFDSLRGLKAEIADSHIYADHHLYSASEMTELRALAKQNYARLVTTEKDFVRLAPEQRHGIDFLPVQAIFEDTEAFGRLIDTIAGLR